jgi:protoporphyrinogen oxidase
MKNRVVIIGAGVSGLTVAHQLPAGMDIVILEKETTGGGLATQFHANGYWFDYGGHYFHFQDKPAIKTYLEQFCSFKEYKRKSKTYLLDRYIPFPVQFHLAYLPAGVKKKILDEMLSAGHGGGSKSLDDFLVNHFGPELTNLFFRPFLTKYYNTTLADLAANMDKGSIPVPDKERVKEGYRGETFNAGYNPVIYYPATSLRRFIANYTAPVEKHIRFDEPVTAIDTMRRTVTTTKEVYYYDRLVNTMPLNHLLAMLEPQDFFPSPDKFRHTSTLLVNVILKQKRKRFHWVYLAEEKFPFYRAGLYAGHPHPACYLERNLPSTASPTVDRKELSRDISYTLKELGVIHHEKEIEYFDVRHIPVSYVIFDHRWHSLVPPALKQLQTVNIDSIGRFGTWNYSSMANDIKNAIDFTRGAFL